MNWIKYTLSLTLMLGQVAFGAGRLQNEDFKSVAQLTAAGSDQSHLLNDTKIYVSANGINSTLASAIAGGSIGGGGLTNYIVKGDAETGSNVNAYKNTAQLLPVNGTGGSPTTMTFGTTTSTPLTGNKSYVFTHAASNGYGEGLSTDFTIPPAQEGRQLTVAFDYAIISGTYVGGSGAQGSESDLEVWAYDTVNLTLIPVSGYKVTGAVSTVPSYQFVGTFQTNSNSTGYRLIFHNATTNTSAWSMKVDNITVTPQVVAKGAVVTDSTPYTMTVGGSTTAPTKGGTIITDVATWRRVGDSAEISYTYRHNSAGSVGSGIYLFPLPPGLTADVSKITVASLPGTAAGLNYGATVLGSGYIADTANGNDSAPGFSGLAVPSLYNSTNIVLNTTAASATETYPFSSNTGINYGVSTIYVTFTAKVPIVGWSSGQVLSSDAGNSGPIAVSARLSSSATVSNGSPIPFNVIYNDQSGGAYSTTTGLFTCPVSATYRVSSTLYTGGTSFTPYLIKNGVGGPSFGSVTTTNVGSGSANTFCLAGQTLGVAPNTTVTLPGDSGSPSSQFNISIEKIGTGNQQIAASDFVGASYYVSANFSAGPTVPVNFDSKEFDSTGASVTTSATAWKYTAPSAGTYQILGVVSAPGSAQNFLLFKNGVQYKPVGTVSSSFLSTFGADLKLLANDYIDVRPAATLTIQGAALSSPAASHIEIKRVGNY